MNLDNLPARNKLYFLGLVKSGEGLTYPLSRTNNEIEQMSRAGYFDRLDTDLVGHTVFKPTQKLRDVCAGWDEADLRRQANAEFQPGLVGGCESGCV